jgi:hypothetical protein
MLKKIFYLLKKVIKKILYSIYYSYPGFQVFDLIKKLTGYKKERQIIKKSVGYYPNLKHPESFNEKVLWKKIYDRNPLLPIISDKYMVRQYLKNFLGEEAAGKILIPLLFETSNPDNIPFNSLPDEFIMKANHACKRYIIAEQINNKRNYTIVEGSRITHLVDCKKSRREIIDICKNWLLKPYGFYRHEWAYQKIKRRIVIEKLIRDEKGRIPVDYKFNMFHGKCQLIQVYYDRFNEIKRLWYTPEWKLVSLRGCPENKEYGNKPQNLKSMIALAETLGKPFDYIRVDLYSVENKIYFGELTNYPMGGSTAFNPVSLDFELGSKWKIVPHYWK